MYIHEAIKQAMDCEACVTRSIIEGDDPYISTKIKPTNSYATCIIIVTENDTGREISRCRQWNPSADDLMATDWVVVN